jgi:hypothetical protein
MAIFTRIAIYNTYNTTTSKATCPLGRAGARCDLTLHLHDSFDAAFVNVRIVAWCKHIITKYIGWLVYIYVVDDRHRLPLTAKLPLHVQFTKLEL